MTWGHPASASQGQLSSREAPLRGTGSREGCGAAGGSRYLGCGDGGAVMGVPILLPGWGREGCSAQAPLQGAALGLGWDPKGKLSQTMRSQGAGTSGATQHSPCRAAFCLVSLPLMQKPVCGEKARESLVPPRRGTRKQGGRAPRSWTRPVPFQLPGYPLQLHRDTPQPRPVGSVLAG